MTGLPGTGKSTIARSLAQALPAAYLAVDPVFGVLERGATLDDPLGKVSYEVVRKLAEMQVRLGLSAVVDAVNPFQWVRDDYRQLASEHNVEMRLVLVDFLSRTAHRERVEKRASEGHGPTWAEVERQMSYYEPPSDFTVRLDAEAPINENLDKALAVTRS
jgi:predicted kinase